MTGFDIARLRASLVRGVNTFRWTGLTSRFGSFDLTTLVSNQFREYGSRRLYTFGIATRRRPALDNSLVNGIEGMEVINARVNQNVSNARDLASESIFDRVDPAKQLDRLSTFLLRRKRLSALRGDNMYFYTDLPRPYNRKGLMGVNVHTGRDARVALVSDPDPYFVTDEVSGLLYSADGNKLQAFAIIDR